MKKVCLLLILVLLSVSFVACGSSGGVENTKSVSIELCQFDEPVELHTALQLAYLTDSNYNNVPTAANGKTELSIPSPVTFTWSHQMSGFSSETTPSSYRLYISENADFSDSLVYSSKVEKVLIYNLKVHTTYYYKVAAIVDGVAYYSNSSTFTTSDTELRNIFIGGVTNVRDLGGYLTNSGKYVKQGMLFRSGRFNTSETTTLKQEITSFGIYQFKDILKLKTEIDLRHSDDLEAGYNESGQMNYEEHSLVGEDVGYTNIHITYSTTNFYGEDSADLKRVFEMLADESNYPLVYHCDIGTDRTGLISVAILGLLGVDMDDIYRDYLFSNFATINATRNVGNIATNVSLINVYPGSTFQERVRNMLKDKLGLTDATLDSIYNILIEQ